ncbi:MAG: hypothetical protein ACLUV8_13145 [Clostridium sp.]
MNRARVDIHCDQVYSMGITGRGIGVAVLDTGIFLHEDLKDRVGICGFCPQERQTL